MKGRAAESTVFDAKLDLRRYFLRKYHSDGSARVFDCCQGDARLWSTLRREFRLANYWGVDLKKKTGRLQIDSAQVLAMPGWTDNVIDIDTYGSPWKHWEALLSTVDHPVTVFFTIGTEFFKSRSMALRALGIQRLRLPPALSRKLEPHAISAFLTMGCVTGKRPIEAVAVPGTKNTRCIGVRLLVESLSSDN